MIFFTLQDKEAGKWEKVKDEFIKELGDIENKFRQLDKDMFDNVFISDNEERKKTAEENLKKLLTKTLFLKDMIVKTYINHLSDTDRNLVEEIELIMRKIGHANDVAMVMARDIAYMIWEKYYRTPLIELPINQIEQEFSSKIASAQGEEKSVLMHQKELRKQQILQEAMVAREEFANNYINQLISTGMAEINKIIKEIIDNMKKEERKED